jgi:hypothetical protein
MAVVGMTGAVYVSDVNTAPVSFNDETCSAVDAQRKRYQIDDPDLIYWDPTYPVLVEVEVNLSSIDRLHPGTCRGIYSIQ